ncbi:sigma-70 family RNA polymerase sigma factor [Nonomuraea sp. NPDC050547]|uniref:sigma-70 family RNA polymerase sigma factor n=1 Tax=Nonomuraea sp. NPDC050547 TaxID=3364368 RepID=UPI00379E7666
MRLSAYPAPSADGAADMPKPPLRGLVRRLRPAGRDDDEIAVAALYREYHRPLLGFVIRLVGGDRQWAEDVVQETMIRAWRSTGQLDSDASSLMPWLATVARRIVIDDRRRKDARPQESGDGPLESVPVPDEMESLLHQVVVSEALKSLSPAHREILNETILRDRSVNDAALALGIPVGTVKSRVYYAVRALRVALEERGVTA